MSGNAASEYGPTPEELEERIFSILCRYPVEPDDVREVGGAVETLVDERSALIARCEELEGALMRIATPKRPDDTYNLSREACEQIAKEALRRADT